MLKTPTAAPLLKSFSAVRNNENIANNFLHDATAPITSRKIFVSRATKEARALEAFDRELKIHLDNITREYISTTAAITKNSSLKKVQLMTASSEAALKYFCKEKLEASTSFSNLACFQDIAEKFLADMRLQYDLFEIYCEQYIEDLRLNKPNAEPLPLEIFEPEKDGDDFMFVKSIPTDKQVEEKAFIESLDGKLNQLLSDITAQYKKEIAYLNENKKHLGSHGWTREVLLTRMAELIATSEKTLAAIHAKRVKKSRALSNPRDTKNCLDKLTAFSQKSRLQYDFFELNYEKSLNDLISKNISDKSVAHVKATLFSPKIMPCHNNEDSDELDLEVAIITSSMGRNTIR